MGMYEPSSWTKLKPMAKVKIVRVSRAKLRLRAVRFISFQKGVFSCLAARTKPGSRSLKDHQKESGISRAAINIDTYRMPSASLPEPLNHSRLASAKSQGVLMAKRLPTKLFA